MNGKEPGWRLWAWIITGAAAWAAAGYWLNGVDVAEAWTYRVGLTAASVVPVLFVAIYTWIGLYGRVPAAWWRDEVGTALVIAALTLIPITWPLAWVFWFQGGSLHSSWLAWLEVSGPCVSALAWLRLCWMWLRLSRRRAGS
jgi:hypothetical protein